MFCSQFPAFFDQYLQSLGGRLDQARLHAVRIEDAARRNGLDVESYLARFAESNDPAVRAQGEVAAAALADAERLSSAFAVLANALAGLRPLVLIRHLDADIAAATAARFAPAAPLSAEGLIYAALGALLALAGLKGIGTAANRARRRLQSRAQPTRAGHGR